MRDDLTCWDYVPEFTGQQAALAIVGEPETDDPTKLRKAMPVLDLMRRSYEGTRRWFADAPEEGDTAPRGLLVSVEMQAARGRVVQLDEVVADHLYCAWPRISEHVSLLFDAVPYCVWPRVFITDLARAGAGDVRFMTWLRTPMADFDRQTFTREVLAHWGQEVGASSVYLFATEKVQAVTADVQTTQSAEQGTGDASCVASWSVVKPERYPGYRKPLYDFLKLTHSKGLDCPTARDVLDAWRLQRPPEVSEVMADGMKYYEANGSLRIAQLKAISKAITRLLKKTTMDQ